MEVYTHHASTAILTYHQVATCTTINALTTIGVGTNTLVHTFMYHYFAYPRGVLKPFRIWITRLQLLQHAMCLSAIAYALAHPVSQCANTRLGTVLGLASYLMYTSMCKAHGGAHHGVTP